MARMLDEQSFPFNNKHIDVNRINKNVSGSHGLFQMLFSICAEEEKEILYLCGIFWISNFFFRTTYSKIRLNMLHILPRNRKFIHERIYVPHSVLQLRWKANQRTRFFFSWTYVLVNFGLISWISYISWINITYVWWWKISTIVQHRMSKICTPYVCTKPNVLWQLLLENYLIAIISNVCPYNTK